LEQISIKSADLSWVHERIGGRIINNLRYADDYVLTVTIRHGRC